MVKNTDFENSYEIRYVKISTQTAQIKAPDFQRAYEGARDDRVAFDEVVVDRCLILKDGKIEGDFPGWESRSEGDEKKIDECCLCLVNGYANPQDLLTISSKIRPVEKAVNQ